MPNEEQLRNLLRRVVDPEVGANIVDLGLVYSLVLTDERLRVEMTMTSPACPMGEMIMDDVRDTLRSALPPGFPVEVVLVWDPPWNPDMMSERTRQNLGW